MIRRHYGETVPGVGGTEPDDFSDNDSTPLQNSEGYTEKWEDLIIHKTKVYLECFKLFDIHFSLLLSSQRIASETKAWNVFRDPLPKSETGSNANRNCLHLSLKIIKVIVYLMTFVVVLGCSVTAVSTILLMTSQLQVDRTIIYCNWRLGEIMTLRYLISPRLSTGKYTTRYQRHFLSHVSRFKPISCFEANT